VPRAKQRTPELRDQVLAAALRVLSADGVAALTARRVADEAATSTPAVYELFGDKGGLVRAVFFEGFSMLGGHLAAAVPSGEPEHELRATVAALRAFIGDNPVLALVMFGRPFAAFEPGPDEAAAGAAVREFVIGRVRRCVESGVLSGDPADIAHVLLGLVLGLAAQESAGWLGTSAASADRRWATGVRALIDGLRRAEAADGP